MTNNNRVILIVLDSVGIGSAPDAAHYGDEGAATLPHIGSAVGGLHLPIMESMGLGNIPGLIPDGKPIAGVNPAENPIASFGVMQEVSEGKDTITGHWEIAGLKMVPGFSYFPPDPPSFPAELTAEFEKRTGRNIIGNRAASGTQIMDELGEEHMKTGAWIAYTSADSVFQIASHVDIIPLKELYRACEIARELCDPYRTGRVIARPFRGTPGNFERTLDRKDYVFRPDEPFITEAVKAAGHSVCAVGKIDDILAHRGLTDSNHTGSTELSQQALVEFTNKITHGLIFANFIDFDMNFGHRRDPEGYADALAQTDQWLGGYLPLLNKDDVLIVTADHGNDPTFKGTDHTREYVPLLVYRPGQPGRNLGPRVGFYDIAQSIASFFGLDPMTRGKSFL